MKKQTLQSAKTAPLQAVKTRSKALLLVSGSLLLSGCFSIPFMGDEKTKYRGQFPESKKSTRQYAKFNEYSEALKKKQIQNIKQDHLSQDDSLHQDRFDSENPEYLSYSEYTSKVTPVYSKQAPMTYTRSGSVQVQPKNGRYAKPKTSYIKPKADQVKPRRTYSTVQPAYTAQQPAYVKSRMAYLKPEPNDVKPKQTYITPKAAYVKPTQKPVETIAAYAKPLPTIPEPQATLTKVQAVYTPQPVYKGLQPTYVEPKATNSTSSYVKPIYIKRHTVTEEAVVTEDTAVMEIASVEVKQTVVEPVDSFIDSVPVDTELLESKSAFVENKPGFMEGEPGFMEAELGFMDDEPTFVEAEPELEVTQTVFVKPEITHKEETLKAVKPQPETVETEVVFIEPEPTPVFSEEPDIITASIVKSAQANLAPVSRSRMFSHPIHTADVTDEASHKLDIEQDFRSNIWDEMHGEFHLTTEHLGEYDSTIQYFKKRPHFLDRVSKRAKPFLYHIFSEVKRRNMPYEIALLPIIESSFRSTARSHQAAGGLWQFIPSTAHMYGLDQNWWFDGRQDAILSTKAALDYLQKLYRLNDNDWLLALASYNGGIGNVNKAVRKYKKRTKNPKSKPDFWDIRPYLLKETRHYVPQLLGVSHVINHAREFNLPLEPIENRPFFSLVKLEKQTTLNKVAKLSGVTEKELIDLNAGYLRPTTPPKGPYSILLPIKNAERLEDAISRNSSLFDIQWIKHVIKPGESLSVIAKSYSTSSKAIKNINGMRNSNIRAGKTLLIPLPHEYANKIKSLASKNQYRGAKKIHTVQLGDSIWSIARYYSVDTRELCRWNRIGIRSPLRKGQKLEIRSDRYGYTVEVKIKKGENLWTLAKRYNVTSKELLRWNNIKKSKAIAPGTLLTIWQSNTKGKGTVAKNGQHRQYKVQRGDNLWNIARANQVTAKILASYNNLPINGSLHPGQVLKIPFKS